MNTLRELGSEIESIMSRYDVPMDDRSLVVDRVSEAVERMAALSARVAHKGHERGKKVALDAKAASRAAIERVKRASQQTIQKLRSKASAAIKDAYVSGLHGSPNHYSSMHILVISVLALIAGILIYREIF